MRKILMYGHGGSGNHGCEAIVRATTKLLNDEGISNVNLVSAKRNEDIYYGISDKINVFSEINSPKTNRCRFLKAYLRLKLFKDYETMDYLSYLLPYETMGNNTVSLSIGGDNYCYGDFEKYIKYHNISKKCGQKTVLWGCSVEPELLDNSEIISDLNRFDKIVVRESISYNAMEKEGLKNIVLYPDPAFTLEKDESYSILPPSNTVGINISPLIMQYEKYGDIVLKNYLCLINYILKDTDMNIALIPHVVWEDNDDRKPINKIKEIFGENSRIELVDDCNCMQLKQYISKLRFLVGARTHATIAAYSSCVPTLVVGYSVKSKGIAKDLFGTFENYVIPVKNLEDEHKLTNSFKWLMENEKLIRKQLVTVIPNVRQKSKEAVKEIKVLCQN